MNAPSHLNIAALENLHRLGGPKFVGKMIDIFLSYVAEKIADAHTAMNAGDLVNLAKAVHPIKSSASNIGADRLREIASNIETLAGQGRGDGLAVMVDELEQAYTAIKPELVEKRKSPLCQ